MKAIVIDLVLDEKFVAVYLFNLRKLVSREIYHFVLLGVQVCYFFDYLKEDGEIIEIDVVDKA